MVIDLRAAQYEDLKSHDNSLEWSTSEQYDHAHPRLNILEASDVIG
jgi:hypothetical protein